ncbi:hypothetical protein FS837_002053 [Tulasnella sp. UAMH 9824]|nr:hypothetical protein FS837_002053 [Tulasnella sp. UAMH 9824]
MVMITTQLAAIVATGIAVSGVSAAALPARNHARAQQQVRMSLDSPAPNHYGRRSVPVAPLPASVSANPNVRSGQTDSTGTGKGKTRKTKAGNHRNDGSTVAQVDAKVQAPRVQARAQVEIGNDDDDAHRKTGPAKSQSNSPNNGKPQPKQNAQPSPKPQSKPQAQASKPKSSPQNSKPKPDAQAQNSKAQPNVKANKQEPGNGSVKAGTHADDPHNNNAGGSVGVEKRAHKHLIKVGSTKSRPAYYYDSADGSLLHVGIGKRTSTVQAISAEVQVNAPASAAADRTIHKKRGLFTARGREPIGTTLGYLASLAGRDVKNDSELQRRDSQPGVEGVINIVSPVASSSSGEKIASLLLSNDPATNNAFVLNASNSSATHVFLVPTNSTAAAASDDGSIPVALHVPVYSPDKASMVDYCMTYDPNPPAPVPLTAQSCTDQVTDHQSQVFSYNPSTGVIVPMWTVAPSSTDPSASSDDAASSTASATATSSVLASTSSTASSSSATDSASPTSSAAPVKRSSEADAAAVANPDDPDCDNTDSVAAASAGNSTMTPQDVTLIFTPSNAAGVLPSSRESAKDMTTFFPPGSAASDDGNVGASSAAPATDATGDEDDGDDAEDDEDAADAADDEGDVTPSSVDPATTDSADEDDGASEDDASAAGVASVDASADAEETITDDEVTPTLSSNSSPSMTPVPDASTPYSWMFTPQK